MCNCGNKRNELTQSFSSDVVVAESNPVKRWPDVNFQYTGRSGLSVTGSITGRKYRFNYRGDVQVIDYRDVPGMMAVPVLKKIRD